MELDRSADPPPAIWVATTKSTVNKWVSEPLYQMLAKYQMLSVSMTQSIQSLSRVWLFVTPWTAACHTSLSITISRSLLTLMSIDSVMPSNLSSSVIPFSSCLQSFPASGSFPMSQSFTSGGQSIGASASAAVLPMNIQDQFLLGWAGLISLQLKGLSRVFSNTIVQKHQFFLIKTLFKL